MSRCLELAAHGRGSVAPNPMVGAVIVAGQKIIGEGFHRCFGEAHAEVNAINSVKDEVLLRRSTLYVNLEPCSHEGKTPPCAELIIRKGIPRVVIACQDPFPEVAGRGISLLKDAGVDVMTGIMEREAIALNRFFMTAHRLKRPFIILKWAQSEDGFIDRKRKDASEKPVIFSNALTRMLVHKLRSEVQAIMVGTNTAKMDNPSLTVRYWSGSSPVRIPPKRDLKETVANLYQKGIHSLMVEGGAQLHRSFLNENLWDEIIVETAPIRLNEGIKSACLPACENFQMVDRQFIYPDDSSRGKPSMIAHFFNYTF